MNLYKVEILNGDFTEKIVYMVAETFADVENIFSKYFHYRNIGSIELIKGDVFIQEDKE